MRRVYVVGGDSIYTNWMEGILTYKMADADLVVFTGGEDVGPNLYGCRPHPTTNWNSKRDSRELEEFQRAMSLEKKMIGICRGAQFLCVMAGGTLVQHQNHPWVHKMHTMEGKVIEVTSTHHQRQYPYGGVTPPKFELLGWCTNLSPYSLGQSNRENLKGKPEVEMAIYPDINALAIQAHPEYVYPWQKTWERKFVEFCRRILNTHMAAEYKVKVA